MKTKLLLFLSSIVMASFLQAQTVSLQPRVSLGDDDGTATNGLYWGVLIDTAGDGFSVTPTGTISAFDFTIDGILGGDSYYVGDDTTTFVPAGPFAGTGMATSVNSIPLGSGIDTGDSWGVFWTDGGSAYGFVTVAGTGSGTEPATSGTVLPSDGATVAYNSLFSGTQTAGGSIGVIPEPSSYALLGGLFALTCVMLRRRA